ncbi:Haloacid dehalogenase domain protein hydrolase [Catenulispora acidiphila DSM 44928]|uniref:Haloacid dehalogenase domain protein hydrolase n=1 Tax=Catenulispora acidiphila (strain DSM 44928 / JCM 14897 / NBRC 102108 / NRRL B-24433 / ID139908) TaxID=479433 RepID=C7Q8F7_CATAD|nr:HAD hydrolase-like protein [Catenulispora acidiphila]ACU76145.1 Haloacid dehalogenase domain protein hydrolase [Catenulispora acidiphila DSM 44928]
MAKQSSLLILWDIDHTLVSISGVSRDIYAQAFEQVVGRQMEHLADMTGRTEEAIIRETLELNGVDPGTSFEAFYEALEMAAHSLEPAMREHGQALPGAREAIAGFAAEGYTQAVVTGNIRSIAKTKLEAFDLQEHIDFEIGGYGDDGSDRAELVRLAIQRTEAKYNRGFKAEHAVVIGDTPHDVRGALDNRALAVGVATGSSSVEELAAADADVVVPDLVGICEVLGRP